MKMNIKRVGNHLLPVPIYKASRFELRANIRIPTLIKGGAMRCIGCGFDFSFHKDMVAIIQSSPAMKKHHKLIAMSSIIECSSVGELFAMLVNHSKKSLLIQPGDVVATIIFLMPVVPMFKEVTVGESK